MSATDTGQPAVSRPMLILLGVVAVGAVIYGAVFLLGGSDDVDTVDTTAAEATEAATPGAPAAAVPEQDTLGELPDVDDDAIELDEETAFEVFTARDPFEQLVAASTGSAGQVDGTTPTQSPPAPASSQPPPPPQSGGSTPPGGGSGSPPSGGGDDPGSPGDAPADPGQPDQATVGTTTITLEEVFVEGGTDKALVRIDDQGYEVAEGETVAGRLTVLDIEGNCATMRFDDTRFILCEGEQVRK